MWQVCTVHQTDRTRVEAATGPVQANAVSPDQRKAVLDAGRSVGSYRSYLFSRRGQKRGRTEKAGDVTERLPFPGKSQLGHMPTAAQPDRPFCWHEPCV